MSDLKLILEDGSTFVGKSFGYEKSTAGELVFNTAMTGYPESLTDPSYKGQILLATYPLIGNYGIPHQENHQGVLKHFESSNIQVQAFITSNYSESYSHWNAEYSLSQWLKKNEIPGLTGIDTRALTKKLRDQGSMLAKIIYNNQDIDFYNPNKEDLVSQVSCKKIQTYGNGKYRILLIDCGVKLNIIRCLLKRDTTIIRVPYDYNFLNENYDGLFISNGPGNPELNHKTISYIQKALHKKQPIFGICLGNQLIALAAGAKTYKLKYGHRSHNQPVIQCGTKRCYITSQNHGYAIDHSKLPKNWEPLFLNANDQSCEGIQYKSGNIFASQFHPEASSGPTDTEFLFDLFLEKVEQYQNTSK
ncbi:MAG: glutamine-hydrolyzing carbamoyl-phosphate synthase small subunit [Bacteroidales bacterium]